MIRRLLRTFASRGEMPDPVDAHHAAIADLFSYDLPRTPGQVLADEVETWLCANYCNHKETWWIGL